jgi:hypothetical protein
MVCFPSSHQDFSLSRTDTLKRFFCAVGDVFRTLKAALSDVCRIGLSDEFLFE